VSPRERCIGRRSAKAFYRHLRSAVVEQIRCSTSRRLVTPPNPKVR
jgi:hypothetical protein